MTDDADPDLIAAIARTIIDPHYWPDALKTLCGVCGASKAFISRRTSQGAHIVVPHSNDDNWHGPMAYGFTAGEIQSYFAEFSENDPWTNIEAQRHPHRPYALQEYLPIPALKKCLFWEWLEPQGIVDCVVAEIGHDNGGWDALTLFLDVNQALEYRQVLKALGKNMPGLSAMWAACRRVILAEDDTFLAAAFVAKTVEPSLALDSDNRILAINGPALDLANRQVIQADVGTFLRVPREWAGFMGPFSSQTATLDAAPEASDWVPVMAQGKTEGTTDGCIVQHRFLLLMQSLHEPGDRPDWDHPNLNAREKRLVRHLAGGGQVKDGAAFFEISVRANAEVWKAASRKLGNIKKQDLVVRNRTHLKDEER